MKHDVYITLQAAPGTDFDRGFEQRCAISEAVAKYDGLEDIGGGTNFNPFQFDIDFEAESPAAVAVAITTVFALLPPGWTFVSVSAVPASHRKPLGEPSEGVPLEN